MCSECFDGGGVATYFSRRAGEGSRETISHGNLFLILSVLARAKKIVVYEGGVGGKNSICISSTNSLGSGKRSRDCSTLIHSQQVVEASEDLSGTAFVTSSQSHYPSVIPPAEGCCSTSSYHPDTHRAWLVTYGDNDNIAASFPLLIPPSAPQIFETVMPQLHASLPREE